MATTPNPQASLNNPNDLAYLIRQRLKPTANGPNFWGPNSPPVMSQNFNTAAGLESLYTPPRTFQPMTNGPATTNPLANLPRAPQPPSSVQLRGVPQFPTATPGQPLVPGTPGAVGGPPNRVESILRGMPGGGGGAGGTPPRGPTNFGTGPWSTPDANPFPQTTGARANLGRFRPSMSGIGRGGLGMAATAGLRAGGDFLSGQDNNLVQDAGHGLSAASFPAGIAAGGIGTSAGVTAGTPALGIGAAGSTLGVAPAAAAAALGIGLGTVAGENLPGNEDKRMANVVPNLVNNLSNIAGGGGRGDLLGDVTLDETTGAIIPEGPLGRLELSDVPTSQIVEWLSRARDQGMDGGEFLANKLAKSNVAGVSFGENGGIEIDKDMEDFIFSIGDADSDDPAAKFIRFAAENHLSEAEIDAGMTNLALARGSEADIDKDQEFAEAVAGVNGQRQQTAAEEEYYARQLAFQEQAMSYLAPVTGGMRQEADLGYQHMQEISAMVPENMRGPMLAQAEQARQQTHSLAAAYENQLAQAPNTYLIDQANQERQRLAGMLQNQMLNEAVYGPSSGGGGSGLDINSLLGGGDTGTDTTEDTGPGITPAQMSRFGIDPNEVAAAQPRQQGLPPAIQAELEALMTQPQLPMLPPPGSPLAGVS